jgi:hypothetical protein
MSIARNPALDVHALFRYKGRRPPMLQASNGRLSNPSVSETNMPLPLNATSAPRRQETTHISVIVAAIMARIVAARGVQ